MDTKLIIDKLTDLDAERIADSTAVVIRDESIPKVVMENPQRERVIVVLGWKWVNEPNPPSDVSCFLEELSETETHYVIAVTHGHWQMPKINWTVKERRGIKAARFEIGNYESQREAARRRWHRDSQPRMNTE